MRKIKDPEKEKYWLPHPQEAVCCTCTRSYVAYTHVPLLIGGEYVGFCERCREALAGPLSQDRGDGHTEVPRLRTVQLPDRRYRPSLAQTGRR